jgi:hypothetical protein
MATLIHNDVYPVNIISHKISFHIQLIFFIFQGKGIQKGLSEDGIFEGMCRMSASPFDWYLHTGCEG